MKRTFVLHIQKEPMTGLIKARCEIDMQNFVIAAATERKLDPPDIVREAVREYARTKIRNPRLRRYVRPLMVD